MPQRVGVGERGELPPLFFWALCSPTEQQAAEQRHFIVDKDGRHVEDGSPSLQLVLERNSEEENARRKVENETTMSTMNAANPTVSSAWDAPSNQGAFEVAVSSVFLRF